MPVGKRDRNGTQKSLHSVVSTLTLTMKRHATSDNRVVSWTNARCYFCKEPNLRVFHRCTLLNDGGIGLCKDCELGKR